METREFKDRVCILRHTGAPANDGSGAIVDSWAGDQWVWCKIDNPIGGDKVEWGALQSSVDAVITIRGNMSVKSVDRLKDQFGNVFLINGLSVVNGGIDQKCVCSSVTKESAGG